MNNLNPRTLRTLRLAHGYGLREAAQKIGVDHSHLSKAERGLVGLAPHKLIALLKLYGLNGPATALENLIGSRL